MRRGQCIHFNGIGDSGKKCEAGVCYDTQFNTPKSPGMFLRMACFRENEVRLDGRGTRIHAGEESRMEPFDRRGETMIPCELFREPTAEEIQKDRIEMDAHLERTKAALAVARAWRVKPKPSANRHEIVECPLCKGRLHLTQSSYNGHVHGACETNDCVRWME